LIIISIGRNGPAANVAVKHTEEKLGCEEQVVQVRCEGQVDMEVGHGIECEQSSTEPVTNKTGRPSSLVVPTTSASPRSSPASPSPKTILSRHWRNNGFNETPTSPQSELLVSPQTAENQLLVIESKISPSTRQPPTYQRKGVGAGGGSWLDLTKLQWEPKPVTIVPNKTPELKSKEKREQKRERKAARTLAIITGSFITSWLPFFILALVRPFCGDRCHYPALLTSVIGWLGYFNSLFNPIIYTIFNPDFRRAFHRIIFGKYRHRTHLRNQQNQGLSQSIDKTLNTSAT